MNAPNEALMNKSLNQINESPEGRMSFDLSHHLVDIPRTTIGAGNQTPFQ